MATIFSVLLGIVGFVGYRKAKFCRIFGRFFGSRCSDSCRLRECFSPVVWIGPGVVLIGSVVIRSRSRERLG